MPLKSLVNESGVRPTASNLNSVYVSLLRLIAIQTQNNEYLEGLTLASGISTSDAGFALVVDPTGATTDLEAVDQRTYVRLQDILGLSSPKTSATDTGVTATLGSTGAGSLIFAGKTGSPEAATSTITQFGTSTASTGTITVLEDTEGNDLLDDTLSIGDGTNTVTFTFKSSYGGSGNPKNGATDYYILIESGDDAKEDIAEAIQYSVDYADDQGDLDITATWAGGTADVVNLTNQAEGADGNVTITSSAAVGDITVSGMSGGVSVGTALDGLTIILEDASSATHTLTYSTSSPTSSTTIGVSTSTIVTSTQAAGQIAAAINAADSAGSIAMSAVDNSDGTVTVTMTGTGVAGNGDNITGTAESGGNITATNFLGGSSGDQFKFTLDGDTATSAGMSVQDADTISLSSTGSISLFAEGNISINGGNVSIKGLTYPSSDGSSANQAIVTDASGVLSFTELRHFTKNTYNASASSYTHTYTPIDGDSRITMDIEASSSTDKLPAYSFSGQGTSGLGAHVDSTAKAHNLFLKFNDDYAIRLTNTIYGDIIQLGNDTTEFNAGTYALVKPSLKGTNAWPAANSTRAGAIFYDVANDKMHFYTSSAVKEVATADLIADSITTSGGTTTGELTVSTVSASITDLDLKFGNASNSGFYATSSVIGTGSSVRFVYNNTSEVWEMSEKGIHGTDTSNPHTPYLNYQVSTGEGTTAGLPAYTFTNDADTGMYRSAADTLSLATGGVRRASVSSSGWDFNNQTVYNLPDPTISSHPVTKNYLESVISSGSVSDALVRYDTTAGNYVEESAVTVPSAAGWQWVEIGSSSTTTGVITFKHSGHAYTTTLQAGSTQAANLSLILPTAGGTNNSLLTTNGSGQLSFKSLSTLGDSRYMQPASATLTDTLQVINGTQQALAVDYNNSGAGSYYTTGQGYTSFTFGGTEYDDFAIQPAIGDITVLEDLEGDDLLTETLVIGDGVTSITFTFVSSYTGIDPKIDATTYEILIESADDTKEAIAEAIYDSISHADTQGDLAITATWSAGLSAVSLTNQANGTAGNVTSTSSADVSDIIVTGMAYGGDSDETITIVDSAATSVTYKMKASGAVAGNQEFNRGTSASDAATNLVALILSSDGHNNTISAVANDGGAGIVDLTQIVSGLAGNTSITHSSNWDSLCDIAPPDAFVYGSTTSSIVYQLPSLNRIAKFSDALCNGVARPSIQGFVGESGRMVTALREDGGPMFTFVDKETTGVGYSETEAVAATGAVTVGTSTGSDLYGDILTIGDGTNTIVFTFASTYGSGNPKDTATTYTIKSDVSTAADIAARIQYSLDYADVQGDLNITSTWDTGNTHVSMVNQVAGDAGNVTTTCDSGAGEINVSGMSGGSDIINSLKFHAGSASTPIMEVKNTGITVNSLKISGLTDPTSSTDAATKSYVDTSVGSLQVPSSAGTADGQVVHYDNATGFPIYDTKLTYTSNILRLGAVDGSGVSASAIGLSTTYDFVTISAPLDSSDTISPYTLTLPTALANSGDVLIDSTGVGVLDFQRRGAYLVQSTYTISSLSEDGDLHSYRYAMGLNLSSGSLTQTLDPSDPTGWIATVSQVGDTGVQIGSSSANFQTSSNFRVRLNGIELQKENVVVWVSASSLNLKVRLKAGDVIDVQGMTSTDITDMGF